MLKLIALAAGLMAALPGCYLKSYPVTSKVADVSTYEAFTTTGSQGTAWIVAPGYAVTAGHLCAAATDNSLVWLKHGPHAVKAEVVYFELTPGPEGDACVLKVDGPTARPLILADKMPATGAAVGLIGYPLGEWASTSGVYLGNGESAIDSDHGASGGPIFTSRGVFSIVISGCASDREDPHCTSGPTVDEIKHMLDDAGVHYDTTPDELDVPQERATLLG